jgi:glycosyltransferase involved in cell wall biosynthesis
MSPNPDPAPGSLRILTNFERFPLRWTVSTGASGTARMVHQYGEFLQLLPESDLVLVNCDVPLALKLCARGAMFPWKHKPLVAVDLVLSRPETAAAHAACVFKKALLRRVDHFINYFKTSEGYAQFYGITPARSSFIPFKPNLRHRYDTQADPDGEYVLCFGRSRRDYDTFFRAIARLPYPAAIPRPNLNDLRAHGSHFTFSLDRLPAQLKLLDDDGSAEAMIRIIRGARIVALPIVPNNLLAGVGVYLNAMLLGKCVIITEGAGANDVLTEEALFVPAGDPEKLAHMIERAWNDTDLRLRTAQNGYRHALSLGGEPELFQRVLEAVMAWMGRRR